MYTIVCDASQTGKVYFQYTLGADNFFHIATKFPRFFQNPEDARTWWEANKYSVTDPPSRSDGKQFWCKGPKGGYHALVGKNPQYVEFLALTPA